MNELRLTGKKALSLLMAVMMILTAWVWVEPTKAQAATAGKYKLAFCVYDNDDGSDGVSELTIKYKTKANNGTGTESSEKTVATDVSVAQPILEKGNQFYIVHVDNADFPSYAYAYSEVANGEYPEFRLRVLVAKAGSSNCNGSASSTWKQVADFEFHHKDFFGSNTGSASTTSFSNKPSASSVSFVSGATSITVPKTGKSNITRNYVAGVYDQYGVRMSYDPTYYIRTSAPTSAQSSSQTVTGVTMNSSTGIMTLTSDAQLISGSSQTIYVHAKYGSVYANRSVTLNDPTYTFNYDKNTTDSSATVAPSSSTTGKYYDQFGSATISGTRTGYTFEGFYQSKFDDSFENPNYSGTKLSSTTRYTDDVTWYAAWQANKYSMKFKYRDDSAQWVTSDTVSEYYGRDIPFAKITDTVHNGVDYTYTFSGWSPEYTKVTATNGIIYTALYVENVHYADYTKLEEQIKLAKEKKEENLYKQGAYTESTVNQFESALKLAEESLTSKLLLSQQAQVDNLTENLLKARENLNIKNFTVIFADESGAILKDGYHFVEYGAKVDVPTSPEKSADSIYHYEFIKWDTEESSGIDACDYVTDDHHFIASFKAVEHTFTDTTTPSSCTTDGVITRECACGYSYSVANPDDLAKHTWSSDYKQLVPATCATKGSEALYCTACLAIDESSVKDIEALGHDFGEYQQYTPATCFGKGSEVAQCSRCQAKDVKEIPQKSHSYSISETVEKTCTIDGYTKEVCELCGNISIKDIQHAAGHDTSTQRVEPTCVSSGYEKISCKNCDYEKTTILEATGTHDYGDWQEVAPATCVGNGVEKRTCKICNSATEIQLTDKIEHSYPESWTVETPATCTVDGKETKTCTLCGNVISQSIPATKHNYSKTKNEPTCTLAGSEVETCLNCGDVITTVIQPLGHDWDDGVEKEADCTHGSHTLYTCKTCGEKKYSLDSSVGALGHDFNGEQIAITPASCTADGEKTVKCTRCDQTTTIIIPKLGHDWNEWVKVDATNDTDGSWTRTCKNGECSESVVIPKGNHTLVEDATAYVAPTCTEKGQRVYTCTSHADCSVKVTVVLDEIQHSIGTAKLDSTCTADGYIKTYCTDCEKVFSSTVISQKEHDYIKGETVEPTCTSQGYAVYTCKDCSRSKTETLAQLNHLWGAWEIITYPTTSKEGLQQRKCLREDCEETDSLTIPALGKEETFTVKFVVEGNEVASLKVNYGSAATAPEISKKAPDEQYHYDYIWDTDFSRVTSDLTVTAVITPVMHSFGNWVTDKKASCLSDGSEHRECSCGYRQQNVISATGHDYSVSYREKDPTCTQSGCEVKTCVNCGDVYKQTLNKLGHSMTYHEYIKATCSSEGSVAYYSCSRCGKNFSDRSGFEEIEQTVIGKMYHTFIIIEGTDATCTENGMSDYKYCSVCGITYNSQPIPAYGHKDDDHDGSCDRCGAVYLDGDVICSCNCHKTDFISKIIYAIQSFFWKLFGSNEQCGCGKNHY